jgi:predicted enzyme related to lactoylglutathione lyase
MLADEFPEIGVTAPRPGEGSSVSLRLEVADVDSVAVQAVAGGGALERPPADSPYGRGATIRDPFGHRWLLAAQPAPRYPNGTREGDVGYISFETPDLARAMAFYGEVLGWTFSAGSSEQGRQVDDVAPMTGLWGGSPRGLPVITWRVDDIDAALERVREAGGSGDEPEVTPYGSTATCIDDQGDRFCLWQPTAEQSLDRPQHSSRQGDVWYLALEVRDADRARAFYATVLGWQFAPGSSRVQDTMPPIGLTGGHAEASAVPMFLVDDIQSTVERLRRRGGTSTDPLEDGPGQSAMCVDDQGTRFWLHQVRKQDLVFAFFKDQTKVR